MLKWIKRLFGLGKPLIVDEVKEIRVRNYYNVRDKKGRFCKKGD